MEGMGEADKGSLGRPGKASSGQPVGHWGRHPGKAEDSELRSPPPTVGLGWRTHLHRGLGWDPPAHRPCLGVSWPGRESHMYGPELGTGAL